MKFGIKTCIVTATVAAFTLSGSSAYAGRTWAEPVTICVPSPAVPAVDAVPAVAEVSYMVTVIDTPAQEAGPDLWWNWSPNHHKGPFDGPPAFPTDSRGTWNGPHENGGPSQDEYGTFQQGRGHGSWFHREHGALAVEEVSHQEKVIDTPAVAEIPGTPAIPAVICPPAVIPPVVTPPVVTPEKPKTPEKTVVISKPKPEVHKTTEALPHTGADEWALALSGLALIAAGIGVVSFYRKRS